MSGKTLTPTLNRHSPELAAPIIASLSLHLLLAAALMFWGQKPPEIVWVDLLEARLITTVREQTVTSPPAQVLQSHRPIPASATKPDIPPDGTPLMRHAEPPTIVPKTIVAPAEDPAAPRADATTGSAPATAAKQAVATAVVDAAGTATPPVQTAEQRYIREQFAYIREQVTNRLVYPPLARRQGWSGEVRVSFIVQADGSLKGLKIVKSSGRTVLDQQALRAVQAAAPFPPPPVPAGIVLPVVFSLAAAHR